VRTPVLLAFFAPTLLPWERSFQKRADLWVCCRTPVGNRIPLWRFLPGREVGGRRCARDIGVVVPPAVRLLALATVCFRSSPPSATTGVPGDTLDVVRYEGARHNRCECTHLCLIVGYLFKHMRAASQHDEVRPGLKSTPGFQEQKNDRHACIRSQQYFSRRSG